MLSRMQRAVAPGSPGARLTGVLAEGGDAGRHVARRRERLVVGVDQRSEAEARPPPARSARRTSDPGRRPPRPGGDSCSSQSPVTFRSSRNVPADAALVGQVGRERRVGDQRPGDLESDERPRAGADERRVVMAERYRRHRGCRVVRGDRDRRARRARLCASASAERRARAGRPRGTRRAESSEPLEQVDGPGARVWVEALRRGRVRQLGRAASAQPASGRGPGSAGACPRRRAPGRSPRPARPARRRC